MNLLIMQLSLSSYYFLSPSLVQIFASALCPQPSSIYVLHLGLGTEFYAYTKQQEHRVFYVLIFTFSDRRRKVKIMNCIVASTREFNLFFGFFVSQFDFDLHYIIVSFVSARSRAVLQAILTRIPTGTLDSLFVCLFVC